QHAAGGIAHLNAADAPPRAAADVEKVDLQQVALAQDPLQPQPVIGVEHVAPGVAADHLREVDDALGGVIESSVALRGALLEPVFSILIVLLAVHVISYGRHVPGSNYSIMQIAAVRKKRIVERR